MTAHGVWPHAREPLRAAPIIQAMRRLISTCLVLLLVLRGLVGSAMAAGMVPLLPPAPPGAASASSQAHAAPGHGGAADHGSAAAHAACAERAADHGQSPDASAHSEHAGGCSACDICHSAMLTPHGPCLLLPGPAQAGLVRAPARFASAPMAPAIKPPIA